jgi:hypothetical protein
MRTFIAYNTRTRRSGVRGYCGQDIRMACHKPLSSPLDADDYMCIAYPVGYRGVAGFLIAFYGLEESELNIVAG